MKIGLVTTSFPRYLDDIAGNFVLGFARALVTAGHEFEVLAPEPARGKSPPSWDKIAVYWVPYMRPRVLSRTFYGAGVPDNLRHSLSAWAGLVPFTLALLREVKRKRSNWDALVSHWALPCALVAGALRNDLPHVAFLHSADLHLLRRLPARSAGAKHIASNARKLVFVSPILQEEFIRWLPRENRPEAREKSLLFPMGIEPVGETALQREDLRRAFGFDRFTLLSIGRLVSVKGIDEAVRAVANRRDIIFAVAGEGPERSMLEKIAKDLRSPVRFLGKVTGSRKQELLRSADAFVCPSRVLTSGRTEGMPTSILEAMAHGLPTVATRVGGVSHVIEHMRSGYLVPPSDQQALRAAIDLLISDIPLRIKLGRGGQKVARRYTWPNLTKPLASMINSAIT
ncbi:MAG: glycosyltransferase family 4 protein [Deltaproteobacteria bacterium]|nr:glycosyltransferase family 4 protein [Deltaproteobacteria bacterium]